jgi:hypothetical protein
MLRVMAVPMVAMLLVHGTGVGGVMSKSDLGRDSPIVKHDPQIKNPCFVICVNSALCSLS